MNRYYGFDLGDAESAISRLGKRDAGAPFNFCPHCGADMREKGMAICNENDCITKGQALEAIAEAYGDVAEAEDNVRALPTTDVVEVVRCKDCEHCSLLFDKRPLCLAGRSWMPITENDFCAWGKKRADNG